MSRISVSSQLLFTNKREPPQTHPFCAGFLRLRPAYMLAVSQSTFTGKPTTVPQSAGAPGASLARSFSRFLLAGNLHGGLTLKTPRGTKQVKLMLTIRGEKKKKIEMGGPKYSNDPLAGSPVHGAPVVRPDTPPPHPRRRKFRWNLTAKNERGGWGNKNHKPVGRSVGRSVLPSSALPAALLLAQTGARAPRALIWRRARSGSKVTSGKNKIHKNGQY